MSSTAAKYPQLRSGNGTCRGSVVSIGDVENGVVIAGIKRNSPASKSGLKAGDLVQRVDKKPIQTTIDIQKIVRSHKPSEKLSFLVLRNNKLLPVEITIGEFPNKSTP